MSHCRRRGGVVLQLRLRREGSTIPHLLLLTITALAWRGHATRVKREVENKDHLTHFRQSSKWVARRAADEGASEDIYLAQRFIKPVIFLTILWFIRCTLACSQNHCCSRRVLVRIMSQIECEIKIDTTKKYVTWENSFEKCFTPISSGC